jgi:hypothetical protein
MPFEGWALPPGFSLREEEKAVLDGGGSPVLEFPDLTEDRFRALVDRLRSSRDLLAEVPVGRILMAVDRVARRLLDPGDDIRRRALESVGMHAGYTAPMAEAVLDGMARDWTRPPLEALLHAEFRDPAVLDRMMPNRSGGEVRALGLPLTFHLGAGTVPGVAVTSMIRALLVKSAVLLKPGRGDVPLSVLFARGFQEVDPELGCSVAVAYWPRALGDETQAAIAMADLVVVYGGNETVEWVRSRAPAGVNLVEYAHRIGVGLVGTAALGGGQGTQSGSTSLGEGGTSREVVMAAARSVALFDQRGCVSPQVFFVEEGGRVGPEEWAELLAEALDGFEEELPSGPLGPEDGASLQQLRGAAEVNESMGRGRVFHGGAYAPWTVLFEPGGHMQPSCLHRTVRVIPVQNLTDVLPELGAWATHLQTVGVAGLGPHREEVLAGLIGLGVTRVTGMEGVPWPPPWWHHDGTGPLQALVRWTDVEGI